MAGRFTRLAVMVAVSTVVLTGCGGKTDSRDGKTYKTVKVGGKTWMAENLNFAAEGSRCYKDDAGNCEKYGRLYNWATALKACPAGFHLPSDDEWTALTDAVGGKDIAGTKLKSAEGWNNNGNGTDDYGWSALPGGSGNSDGSFDNAGYYGYWWSATEYDADYAWCPVHVLQLRKRVQVLLRRDLLVFGSLCAGLKRRKVAVGNLMPPLQAA